jgi:hypothetical protein
VSPGRPIQLPPPSRPGGGPRQCRPRPSGGEGRPDLAACAPLRGGCPPPATPGGGCRRGPVPGNARSKDAIAIDHGSTGPHRAPGGNRRRVLGSPGHGRSRRASDAPCRPPERRLGRRPSGRGARPPIPRAGASQS